MGKYDAIEHTFNTLKLQNKEYIKHANHLSNENTELRAELMSKIKNKMSDHPLIVDKITFIEEALVEKDHQIKELKDQLSYQRRRNQLLSSENTEIKKQNNQFQDALENSNSQITILKRLHNGTVLDQHRQIDLLQNENDSLQKEIAMFRDKVMIIDNLKVNDKANGYIVKHTRGDSIIPRLGNALSIESYKDIRKYSVSYSGYSGAECLEFIEHKDGNDDVSEMSYEDMMSQFQSDNFMKFEEMEKLKLKLTALESRNCALMQQMEQQTSNKPTTKSPKYSKAITSIAEDASDSSSEDMDKLFQKCDDEISMASFGTRLTLQNSIATSRLSLMSRAPSRAPSVASSVLDLDKVLSWKKKKKYVRSSFIYKY